MAFLASNAVPSQAYNQIKSTAWTLRQQCTSIIARLSAENANYEFIHGIYMTVKRAKDSIDAKKTVPGLADYAQAQEDDPAYNVVTEAQAMLATCQAVLNWMDANVPVTNITLKPVSTWSDDGIIISNTFTPAQTASLRTALQTIVDAIS